MTSARRTGNRRRERTVEALRHEEDTRTNIPTAEYQSMVQEDQETPLRKAYQRRNRDLDPQLVWRGKDEQDLSDLVVNVPPLYIQEKVHPKALIADLMRQSQKGRQDEGQQLDMFADFNGLARRGRPHRLLPARGLLVQPHDPGRQPAGDGVAGRAGRACRARCSASTSTRPTASGSTPTSSGPPPAATCGTATRPHITREPEQVKAFRDTWRDGIHSYLSYLRDRLTMARDLLADSGSIFVQIGDDNVHRIRDLMDEVFGEENFCCLISFVTTGGIRQKFLATRCDYVLWFTKNKPNAKYRQLYQAKDPAEGTAKTYTWVELDTGVRRGLTAQEKRGGVLPLGGRLYRPGNITTQGNPVYPFTFRGKTYSRPWKSTLQGMERVGKAERLHVASNSLSQMNYLEDFAVSEVTSLWTDTFLGSFAEDKIYVVQTSQKTIQRCILMTTDPGDLVLDPTCGSGTTAYAAEQWGRRWITIDTSRVALAPGPRSHHGRSLPLLHAGRQPRGAGQGGRGLPPRPVADVHLPQRPPRLRARARAPHHPAGHRQQHRD